jgi:hypothetical protein
MPTLMQVISDGDTNIAVAWQCTECTRIFDFGRMNINPSREQVEALNERFREHCAESHPDSVPVIGLKLP